MATLKGFADLAAKIARDRQAFIDQTTKLPRSFELPARSFELPVPEIPDTAMPALREIVPLAEQLEGAVARLADRLKPQGTLRHTKDPRGRKPKWDWERAGLAVLGRIYRGEVPEPKTQAEVERLLAEWFSENCDGATPSETMIREHARLIWHELSEAGN